MKSGDRAAVLAFPMSAITRDHGDHGDPPIPCSFPVKPLFVPCSEFEDKSSSGHGIRVLQAYGDQNAEIFPVISLLAGNLVGQIAVIAEIGKARGFGQLPIAICQLLLSG